MADEKIITRYARTLELLLPAILLADKSYLFDNSTQEMILIAQVEGQAIHILVGREKLPNWFTEHLINRL